ncbi:MAG TPA: hypothetical protein VMW08_05255 [Acidimicrobiales bacterium]|nr:hypothetical protein [Acidimicrobiales bacterium]
MSEPVNPIEGAVERVLEAFVYAPIGLVFDGPDPFPALVEKGKNQVTAARMMGEFAVRMGQGEACKLIGQMFGSEAPGAPMAPSPASRTGTVDPNVDETQSDEAANTSAAKPPVPRQPSVKPDLAIPDYDGLSASQVVTRLGGLSPDELEAVRRHEAGNRGRKTILNKVAQIQA